MSNAASVVNDKNVAGTQMCETTVSGDGSSCITLTNDGVFSVGNATHPGKFSCDNGAVATDGSGNVSSTSIQNGSSSLFKVSGNTLLANTGTNKIGAATIGQFSFFTIASTQSGSHAYAHGFSGTPAFIFLASTSELPNYCITAFDNTNVTINFTNAGQAYTGMAIG